jgi:hypothetical protein
VGVLSPVVGGVLSPVVGGVLSPVVGGVLVLAVVSAGAADEAVSGFASDVDSVEVAELSELAGSVDGGGLTGLFRAEAARST